MRKKNFDLCVDFRLSVSPSSSASQLVVFVDSSPSLNVNRSPKLITLENYDVISSLSIKVDGFDSFEKISDSHALIDGEISVVISNTDGSEKSIPIQKPSIKIPLDGGRLDSSSFTELRAELINQWHDAFFKALSDLNTNLLTSDQNKPTKAKREFLALAHLTNIFTFPAIKYSCAALISLAAIFMGLGVYERVVNINSQQNAGKITDPARLVSEHDALMNKALEDMGIDRSKLTNDLSCFVE